MGNTPPTYNTITVQHLPPITHSGFTKENDYKLDYQVQSKNGNCTVQDVLLLINAYREDQIQSLKFKNSKILPLNTVLKDKNIVFI